MRFFWGEALETGVLWGVVQLILVLRGIPYRR